MSPNAISAGRAIKLSKGTCNQRTLASYYQSIATIPKDNFLWESSLISVLLLSLSSSHVSLLTSLIKNGQINTNNKLSLKILENYNFNQNMINFD